MRTIKTPAANMRHWLLGMLSFLLVAIFVWMSSSCVAGEITPAVTPHLTILATSAVVATHTSTEVIKQTATQTLTITPVAVLPSVASTQTSPPLTATPTVDFLKTITGRVAFIDSKMGFLEMIDATGDNSVQLTDRVCFFNYTLSWSPDGHWIAFDCAFEMFRNGEIYIVNINSREIKQITHGSGNETDLAWSPDGQYIAYVKVEENRSDDIAIVNVEDGETRKLTYTSFLEVKPSWSPDGEMIAFLQFDEVRVDSVAKLMVMSFETGEVKAVTDFPAGWSQLTWSPDSREIAFVSAEDCGELYAVNVDGSDLRQLTNIGIGCPSDPDWSPDGNYIIFSLSVNNTDLWMRRLFVLDLERNSTYRVTSHVDWWSDSPAWQPVPFMQIGQNYSVTETGGYINLRQSPSVKGAVLTQLVTGSIVTVLEGPVDVDDYYWWKLRTENGTEGWAVEQFGWYQLISYP
jgi:Tol biopolymer transport system component